MYYENIKVEERYIEMNYLKSMLVKLKYQPMIFIPLVCLGLYTVYFSYHKFMTASNLYLTYLLYINTLAPTLMALIISAIFKFEEQNKNYNRLLSISNRSSWTNNMVVFCMFLWLLFTIFTIGCLSMIVEINFKIKLITLITLFVLNLIFIPIFIYIALKLGSGICIGIGALFFIIKICYGTTMLGNGIWNLIPFVYPEKSVYILYNSNYIEFSKLIGISLVILIFLLVALHVWYCQWNGREITD